MYPSEQPREVKTMDNLLPRMLNQLQTALLFLGAKLTAFMCRQAVHIETQIWSCERPGGALHCGDGNPEPKY